MKRKLVSVLLALTLCGSLAIPVFAGPAEEPLAPEESEVLPVEKVPELEEVHEHEDEAECVAFFWGSSDLPWEIGENEKGNESIAHWRMPGGGISVMGANPDGTCTDCGKNNWQEVAQEPDPDDWVSENSSTHKAPYLVAYVCLTPGCISGYYVTRTAREPHSLQKTFTGNHYHVEGSVKHMAEYRYTCSSGCGYSTTKWEYYICPGGSGGGCLYPTSLDEEELMGDVTGPEDAALPEDVTGPAESENLQAKEIHEHENESETLIYTWDCEFPDYSDGDLISWTWTEGETEEGVKVLHLCLMLVEDPAMIDAASTASVNEGTPFHTHLGIPEVIGHEYKDKGTYHEVYDVIKATCSCGESITKTKLTGEEPHSLQKTFTGNHYHVEGSVKHMAEYRYTCSSGCGYSTTKWEYYICPGGSGGGCLYPTSLDEEELMGDVTGPEDAALPEDVVLPEDVTTPEDAMELDETGIPEEITTPEETTEPEEPYE